MYKILLVEDDAALAEEISKQLCRYDFTVKVAEDFRNIAAEFESIKPQLVLMDIMLPFRDGYFWTAEIRKSSTVPIIFISSVSDKMNIVMAINMGGDDFIAKPFDAMVLTAKVQAIIRRTYELEGNASKLAFYGAVLNLLDSSVTSGESRIELTRNEFKILQILLENKGIIVSRDALMLKLWNRDCFVEENTLTVNVTRLRKKLSEIGLNDIIVTKPGSGYIIQ